MTGSWAIRRTRPVGLTLGTAIPVFIDNMQYHLTTVDAYADGAIDAWGFLDLPLFRKKVRSGWVATAPPAGSRLSVFNLGLATVSDCNWLLTPPDVAASVESEIAILNTDGKDLLDLHGSDVELRSKVSYAKLGLSDKKPVVPGNSAVVGEHVPIFRRDNDSFHLDQWFVFADGTSRIGTKEPLQDLDVVLQRISSGELATKVPDGSLIRLDGLGS